MIWMVILIPAGAAVAAIMVPWGAVRRGFVLAGALGHVAAVAMMWQGGMCGATVKDMAAPRFGHAGRIAACAEAHTTGIRVSNEVADPASVAQYGGGEWVGVDATALLFLSITSLLFLTASIYGVGYLMREARSSAAADEVVEESGFRITREGVFCGCLLLFLSAMSLSCVSQHLGLLWVAIEATTLASAPLIYFHRHHRSLEAMWKYLLICSVGIALAMLGNFCLAFAARGLSVHLSLPDLLMRADGLDGTWLKAAFIMLLVGYGTKMGLAPMHTWLPDAHSEAPSMVSALLSGALLNCAFLAILRPLQILSAAGLGDFGCELMRVLGLASMGVAAGFILRQGDYKRMLAYSSVEHMGILALGIGVGGIAQAGAMLHAVNHSVTKGMMFLLAGNLLAAYGTKNISEVGGVMRRLPVSGLLWLAGLLAITGSPPFGTFNSELMILRGALEGGRWGVAIGYLAALGIIFAAMSKIMLTMVYGQPGGSDPSGGGATLPAATGRAVEPMWSIVPPIVLAAGSMLLGVYIPPRLMSLIQQAAQSVGVQ